MQLETSRFFSDRLIFDESNPSKFQIAEGFWEWVQRVISWIWSSAQYSEENLRTVECFQRFLIDALGPERLQRISSRFELDWEEMKKYPLSSRDVAKIFIGSKCVTVEDINALGRGDFLEVDSATLAEMIQELSTPFDPMWEVAEITDIITGRPTEWLASIFYDPLLAGRERLQLVKDHPQDTFENFIHNMVTRVIKRELDVGTIIPAPNHPEGRPQFYYVSAKLVTGKGMVSYILHPAGNDSNLEPIRLFRGTSPRNSELDALSTVITDLEKDLGLTAYRSGNIFEPIIQEQLGAPTIEAGHSMGSTLVQHRLVDLDHIQTAYLYCGPGITEGEVERFNQKNPHVHLVIRVAENDEFHRLGEVHLGYHAPANVQVDFVRYCPIGEHDHNPHVSIWGRMPLEFEGDEMPVEVRDMELYHKEDTNETIRSLIGPIIATVLEFLKDLIRFFFSSRIAIENGLKIGHMIGPRWQVDHFRAV